MILRHKITGDVYDQWPDRFARFHLNRHASPFELVDPDDDPPAAKGKGKRKRATSTTDPVGSGSVSDDTSGDAATPKE